MQIIKQSTAVTLKIGPFLDDTDGKTAETALTIAQADVRLSKNGGDIAQKTEATSCTHDELGIYGCPIDTTDTGTLGRLQLWVHESGALPVWHEFLVVTANVYDTLCSTDILNVNITHIADTSQTANDNGADINAILVDTGTTLDGLITTVDTVVDTILVDTNELQTDLADGGRLDLLVDAIKTQTDDQPAGFKKGVGVTKFPFLMIDSTDHFTPKTGLTVTVQISKDGGAFAAVDDGTATEISDGFYYTVLTATEMTADLITLIMTATGADQTSITIKTSA